MSESYRRSRGAATYVPEPTNAAKQVIDHYLLDQRLRILQEAARNRDIASGRIDVDELRLAITRINTADMFLPASGFEVLGLLVRRPRFLRFALWCLIAVALSAIAVVLIIPGWHGGGGVWAGLPALSAVAGFGLGALLTAFSLFLGEHLRVRRQQHKREADSALQEFVREMKRLEDAAIRVASSHEPEHGPKRLGLRSALRRLVDAGVWPERDVGVYLRLLSMRNGIVHEDISGVAKAELAFVLSEISRLMRSLHENRADDNRRNPAFPRPRSEALVSQEDEA